MNLKSIYETLTALGTGAMIVGCGAQQTPVNTAESPPVETAPASAMKEASGSEADAPMATPAVASSEEKPSTKEMAALPTLGGLGGATPAGATPAEATPAGATPAKTTSAPVAAKAKPVVKKSTAAAKTTGNNTGKKKDASSACGEGGCG